MAYEIEEIRLSQQIFYYLLEHFELREEEEERLYRAYTEEEAVQNLVKIELMVQFMSLIYAWEHTKRKVREGGPRNRLR